PIASPHIAPLSATCRVDIPTLIRYFDNHLRRAGTQGKGFRILLLYHLPSWHRYLRQTLRRNVMCANWPCLRISTKPALTSSLRWCDSVAAVIGSSPRTSLHASSRHLAIRDKSSYRRGSARALLIR